jgi:hypothetical protein
MAKVVPNPKVTAWTNLIQMMIAEQPIRVAFPASGGGYS